MSNTTVARGEYTLSGTALLISFAVGLAWVAVVFLFKRAFKALA